MKRPYHLVPDDLSKETAECLRQLLKDAEAGQLIGIAFAAMYSRSRYIVNTAGEAHRSPTFTRGMVGALQDELAKAMRE